MGELWVQVREPASVNRMQGKQGRPPTSTLGLHTHAHMCRHTHTCVCTCMHVQREKKWSLNLLSQSFLIVAKSWLTGSSVCPTAWTVDTAAPIWVMIKGSRPFSSTSRLLQWLKGSVCAHTCTYCSTGYTNTLLSKLKGHLLSVL